jgi:glycosyltransferase involved in cell wall biosynthesis
MSVYHRENAEYLRTAMDSIWNQTIPTDDFILVCDGPLNEGLDAVIDDMQATHPDTLHVVRLKTNGGLGNALNIGIKHCKHELVARMDSDDISRPDRCERQLKVFQEHPDVSICSGIVEEFIVSTSEIEARRVPPETQNEIVQFAKKRNPFNHPCVMYKKTAVEAAGGYQDFYLLEDYYLWIRMLQKGSVGYNLQEPLLWMRAGSDMYKRRAGWKYAQSQKSLFKYMKDSGLISGSQYMQSVAVRTVSSITPNWLREFMFKTVMRKK